MRRAIFRTIKIVVGLEVAWLILANTFLATGLAPWAINRQPDTRTITWQRAWSVIPGRMYVRGLVFDQMTRTLEIEIRADRAAATVGFTPLLSKKLLLDRINVGSLSVEVSPRVSDGSSGETPADIAPSDFRIVLNELQIEEIGRFTVGELEIVGGESRLEGNFEMQARSNVEVRDAVLDWQGAEIRLREKTVAASLSIGFRGAMLPFDPRQQKGLAVLRKLSGELDVEGRVKNLRPLEALFQGAKWIERLDGQGNVALHLVLDSGRLQPGSDIDVDAEVLELDFLGFETRGSGRVDAEVIDSEHESGRLGSVTVDFDQFSLGRKAYDLPTARGTGLKVVVQAADLGLGEGLHAIEATVDIPSSEVPDISFLNELLPPGLGIAVAGGSATLAAHLDVVGKDELITGTLDLLGDKLTGAFRDMDFEMDLKLATLVSGTDLDDFNVALDGSELRVFNGVFDDERGEREEGWWMTIAIPEGTAHLGEPLEVEAEVDLAMRDSTAIVALFAEVKTWMRYLEGMLTVRDVKGGVSITLTEKELSLRKLHLEGENLEVLAELEVDKESSAGIFWFKYRVLGLALERLGNEAEWKLYKAREWYDEQHAANWVSRPGTQIEPRARQDSGIEEVAASGGGDQP